MIVTEVAVPDIVIADDPHRPKGVHVSAIIGDILKRMDPARYDKHDADGKPVPMDAVKVTAGLSYERSLERLLIKSQVVPGLFRPDPLQKDGVWGSPDGIDPDLFGPVEYKLTWYSARKVFPDDPVYWPYVTQVQAYCAMLDAVRAVVWIQYVNGDYAPPRPWAPKKYRLEFTEQEVQDKWQLLIRHAQSLGWLP